jgi:glutamyl-tRNA reductase
LVGTDFRCAPLELRERVAFGAREAEEVLVHLLARPEVGEAYLLSTCNRTEALLQPREEDAAYRAVLELVFLPHAPELERPGRIYVKRNGEAARHVLAVASGLESMVLGEPEVLGQVKQAAALAEAVGASGPVLRKLLRTAVACGGRARAETAIAGGAVSLGYAVVELARNIFSGLDDCRVLLLGAGETARLVARSLVERGVAALKVANRSAERAESFRAEFPTTIAVGFDQRVEALDGADLVVATTAAEEPVLTHRQLQEAMAARRGRPLLVVDLGVPRNVEPAAAKLGNLFLHTVDSLESIIQRNLRRRREEVGRVEELIESELSRFRAWYRGLEAEPVIASLQKQAERIRQQELAEALARFPAETHDELERLTRALVRKILHHPSARLRARDEAAELARLDLVRELFRLDDEEP